MKAWAIVDKETGEVLRGSNYGFSPRSMLLIFVKREQARTEYIKGTEKIQHVEITIIKEETE